MFLFVTSGIVAVGGKILFERDSTQITGGQQLEIELTKDSEILLIEV